MTGTIPPNYPENALPGDPRIVQLLMGQALIHGHSINEMCGHIGITFGYFNQWRNGIRKTEDISEPLARAVAQYIELSLELVLAAAKPR